MRLVAKITQFAARHIANSVHKPHLINTIESQKKLDRIFALYNKITGANMDDDALRAGLIIIGNATCEGVSTTRGRYDAAGASRRMKLDPEVQKRLTSLSAQAKWKEGRVMENKIADPLSGLLFGQERTLVNLKMLRGDDPSVLEADLRNEAHSALLQVILGTCETSVNFPEDPSARRVDINTLANI